MQSILQGKSLHSKMNFKLVHSNCLTSTVKNALHALHLRFLILMLLSARYAKISLYSMYHQEPAF